jgi:hypothetical protein
MALRWLFATHHKQKPGDDTEPKKGQASNFLTQSYAGILTVRFGATAIMQMH